MQSSVAEPAAHGTDVVIDVVPSKLWVVILSKKVWIGYKKENHVVARVELEIKRW